MNAKVENVLRKKEDDIKLKKERELVMKMHKDFEKEK